MSMFRFYALRLVLLAGALELTEISFIALITHRLDTTVNGLFLQPVAVLVPLLLPALLAAFAVYLAGVGLIERRPVQELALAPAAVNLVLGMGSGALLFASVFGAISVEGLVTYSGYTGLARLPSAALVFTAGVVFEELIFRGAILRVSEESLGTAMALLLSALLFAGSHLGNEGVTLIGTLALVAGGITLGLAYVLSRNLWLPIGAHLGWNFAMGAVFGTAVSGHEAQGVFKFSVSGPGLLTGGRFGPESSIYSALFLVLLATVLGRLASRRSDWKSLRFRMSQS